MAETLKQVVNMDLVANKRRVMQSVQMMTGLWEVSFKKRKLTRSLNANKYYFAAIVNPFTEWLREQYGDPQIDSEQAHEMLKVKILGWDEKLIPGTDETLRLIPRSRTLDSSEFAEYINKCAAWLAEFCNIVVISSDLFWEAPEKPKNVLKYKPKSELRKQLEGSIELLSQRASQ